MDLPAVYVATTESLLATLSISHQAGHLCAGLIIYLGVLYLLSARWGHILPLLAVFLAEFGNETLQAAHDGSWRTADTIADIGWTVFWPCIVFVYGIHRRRQPVRSKVRRMLHDRAPCRAEWSERTSFRRPWFMESSALCEKSFDTEKVMVGGRTGQVSLSRVAGTRHQRRLTRKVSGSYAAENHRPL